MLISKAAQSAPKWFNDKEYTPGVPLKVGLIYQLSLQILFQILKCSILITHILLFKGYCVSNFQLQLSSMTKVSVLGEHGND